MPVPPPRLRLLTLTLLLTLTTAACGGQDDTEAPETTSASSSPASPAEDIEVPDGVELTEPGAQLDFGEAATVAYQADANRGSVLDLTVVGVRTGRVRDLAAFQLDDATRASTPYYVRARVANVGTDELGRATVPLYAVDDADTLIQASSFTTGFEPCPSTPLPRRFGAGARTTVCLVYLVPEGGALTAVSYRPLQRFEAITWTGAVQPARRPGRG